MEAYRTCAPEGLSHRIDEVFARRPDCITFTSSSTVKNFAAAGGGLAMLRGVAVASIGPITSGAARDLRAEVTVEANPYTVDGLVQAITGLYTEETPPSTE